MEAIHSGETLYFPEIERERIMPPALAVSEAAKAPAPSTVILPRTCTETVPESDWMYPVNRNEKAPLKDLASHPVVAVVGGAGAALSNADQVPELWLGLTP